MTEKQLLQICTDARNQWNIDQIVLIHRIGELTANEPLLFLGVTCKEQATAFAAIDYVLKAIRNTVAIWTKQTTPDCSRWLSDH